MLGFTLIQRPEPEILDLQPLALMTEYEEVAADLGVVVPTAIAQARLGHFITSASIPTYDTQAVERYMDSITGRDCRWVWRPLRAVDAHGVDPIRWKRRDPANGELDGRIYEKPVPLRVLKDAAVVAKEFPSCKIFVTEIVKLQPRAIVNPDPFIAVTMDPSDDSLFVFGVWDEPGFTG